MPDNCKNFSSAFPLTCKDSPNKDLDSGSAAKKPPGPHVLEVAGGLQDMLDAGAANNRADLARRLGVSRARVTRLLGLLKLPAEIREEILSLPEEQKRCFSERGLRAIARMPSAAKQVRTFERLKSRLGIARHYR